MLQYLLFSFPVRAEISLAQDVFLYSCIDNDSTVQHLRTIDSFISHIEETPVRSWTANRSDLCCSTWECTWTTAWRTWLDWQRWCSVHERLECTFHSVCFGQSSLLSSGPLVGQSHSRGCQSPQKYSDHDQQRNLKSIDVSNYEETDSSVGQHFEQFCPSPILLYSQEHPPTKGFMETLLGIFTAQG